jgi:hypothetical protein
MLTLTLCPENGGSTLHLNINKQQPDYMGSHLRRQEVWNLEITLLRQILCYTELDVS